MPRKPKNRGKKQGAGTILALPESLEKEARFLYREACCGAEDALATRSDHVDALNEPEFRRRFYVEAHNGFRNAQEHALERLSAESPPSHEEEALLRKAIDSIAWQILRNQLYLARRLYRGHRQPSARHANLRATMHAARDFSSEDPARFALLSDLTTFVQIGDLLTIDPSAGWGIAEVKEGQTNRKVLDFAHNMSQTPCLRAMHFFREQEGEQTFEQLGRVLRQGARMSYITDIVRHDRGTDPDTGEHLVVPSDPLPLDSWDAALSAALLASHEKGWAIDVVRIPPIVITRSAAS